MLSVVDPRANQDVKNKGDGIARPTRKPVRIDGVRFDCNGLAVSGYSFDSAIMPLLQRTRPILNAGAGPFQSQLLFRSFDYWPFERLLFGISFRFNCSP